jgi:hypothetical protein
MAVPHYAYLTLKIPGPKGTITVQGSFKISNTCDKEFVGGMTPGRVKRLERYMECG